MKELYLLKAIKYIIAFSFFTPLFFFKDFYFPFIVPKTVIFQVLIEIALLLYIILVFSNKKYLPKFDLLTKSVLFFFLAYTIAAFIGENPQRSFFGVYERMLGVFNMAHFVALFLIMKSIFLEKKDWIFLFRSFITAGFLAALYGLGQAFGIGNLYNSGVNRVDSTVGNAGFFAAYMIFNFYFALLLLLYDKAKNIFWRYYYAIVVFFSFLAMYLTETRGALIGFILSLFFLLGSEVYFHKKGFVASRIIGILKSKYAFAFYLLFAVLFGLMFNKFSGAIDRILSISLQDATTKTRLYTYQTSWEGLKDNFLFGVGPENYNLVFDKYFNPNIYPIENWFDHAHNIIFDTWSDAGIIGLLLYFAIFITALILAFRKSLKSKDEYFVFSIILALFVAYLIQNLFIFDSLSTYLAFFFVLGFICWWSLFKKDDEGSKDKEFTFKWQGIFAVILILSSIYYLNIRPLLGSYYIIEGLVALNSLKNAESKTQAKAYFDLSLTSLKKAFNYANLIGKPEIVTRASEFSSSVLNSNYLTKEEKLEYFSFLIDNFQEVLNMEPENVRYRMYYINLMKNLAFSFKDNGYLQVALSEVKKTLELAPTKPIVYLQAQEILNAAGYKDEALKVARKAYEIAPHADQVRLSLVAQLLLNKKNKEAFDFVEKMVSKEGKDIKPTFLAKSAVLFARFKDYDSAIKIAKLHESIFGTSKEIDNFIKSLEKIKVK